MNRRSLLASVLGLVAVPFLPKPKAASRYAWWVAPDTRFVLWKRTKELRERELWMETFTRIENELWEVPS